MTTMGCTPDQFASLARRYPDVPIIMGHGAGFQNLYFPSIRPVKELHNLFADTAMTTVDDSRLIEVTRIVGAEKVIFGSDHWSREQKNLYGNFFFVLERAFPDPEQRRLILGGNIAKVLGLQG
jgi:predicted TIM-barrel fold metal-dependent hydrolase